MSPWLSCQGMHVRPYICAWHAWELGCKQSSYVHICAACSLYGEPSSSGYLGPSKGLPRSISAVGA